MSLPEHYNPLLVTVLPRERRSRHSYQLGAMMCLFTLGLWQLVIGTSAAAAAASLDHESESLLNWVCVVAGATGVLAAVIPERIVRLRFKVWRWILRTEFDATYFRLWEEFGCHMLLLSVWMAYGQTVWANYGLVKGYSLGLAAAVWFGWSALVRAWQIMLTLYRSGTFTRRPSAVVGDGEIDLGGAV